MSHGPGAVIFDTCGAKAGLDDDDLGGRSVGDDLTGGHDHHAVGDLATNSTSCVDTTTRPAARRELAERTSLRAALAGGVEAAGGLVEQQDRGIGGELDGEDEGQLLSLGQVSRVLSVGYAGCQVVEQAAAGAGRARRSRGRPGRHSAPTVSR